MDFGSIVGVLIFAAALYVNANPDAYQITALDVVFIGGALAAGWALGWFSLIVGAPFIITTGYDDFDLADWLDDIVLWKRGE